MQWTADCDICFPQCFRENVGPHLCVRYGSEAAICCDGGHYSPLAHHRVGAGAQSEQPKAAVPLFEGDQHIR